MTKNQILDDLTYASTLAREGATSPLLGGRIGLMWGILLSVVLTLQWAILSQVISLPYESLLYIWIACVVTGSVGSMVMGRKIDGLDGARSAANRVEKYVWIMFSAMMGSLFAGVLLNIHFTGGKTGLYGLLVIVGFAGQGLAYGVVALMSKANWLRAASFASFFVSALCFAVYGRVLLYLIGGLACLCIIVIPSLISIKKESRYG